MVFNLDKGHQSNIGAQALSFGTLAKGDACGGPARYVLLERTARSASPARTDASARLWVYLGSDSGFEGKTTYYIDRIQVTLTPR